jgi:hypothetical protein
VKQSAAMTEVATQLSEFSEHTTSLPQPIHATPEEELPASFTRSFSEFATIIEKLRSTRRLSVKRWLTSNSS